MMCNVILGLCVVGGMQVGPDVYVLQVMDAEQSIHDVAVHIPNRKKMTEISEAY